jgi:hypothetical protein
MANLITSHPQFRLMKKTIDSISTDDLSKFQVCIGSGKLVTKEHMEDGYVEDLEIAGTTLLIEKPQAQAMSTDTITLGGSVRYLPRTMAKKVSVTQEAMEDGKYKEAIQAAKRLTASAYRTEDADFASLIITSTSLVGGYDQVVLASSSHKLPNGSTTSNIATAYSSPSLAALILAKAQLGLMPGPNGLVQPLKATHIVCPLIQEDVWRTLLGSEKVTGSNFNDINIVKTYGLKILPIYHLDGASSTQWGLKTDAEEGFKLYYKRAITSNSWVDNDGQVMHYGVSYRNAQGWSNWRCWFQGQV